MNAIFDAAKRILLFIVTCEDCDGTGKERGDPESACCRCGGYGEEPVPDIMEAVHDLRAAIDEQEERKKERERVDDE